MRNPTPERIASVLRLYADPDQKWNEVMLRSVMNDMAKALDDLQTAALSHAAGQEAVAWRVSFGSTSATFTDKSEADKFAEQWERCGAVIRREEIPAQPSTSA